MPDTTLKDDLKAVLDEHGADPSDVAATLKEVMQPAYQTIYDQGHSQATAKKSDDLQALQQEREELQQKYETASQEADELRKKQPDIEKWRQEKEEALLRKEQEWKEKYQSLQQKREQERIDAARSQLVGQLQQQGLDEWTAKRAIDSDVLARLKPTENGVQVYQPDGETPLAADDPLAQLASEVVQGVPEHLRQGPKQQFGGAKGRTSSNGRSFTREQLNSMSDEEYAQHRESILGSADSLAD